MHKLVWLRNDLRIHDNESFARAFDAAREQAACVYAVYCICDDQWTQHGVADARRLLVLNTLQSLRRALELRGVTLIVRDSGCFAQSVIDVCQLAAELQCDQVFCGYEYPLNERRRDQQARLKLQAQGVALLVSEHACLLPLGSVRTQQGGMYRVFTPFKRAARQYLQTHRSLLSPAGEQWRQPLHNKISQQYAAAAQNTLAHYQKKYQGALVQADYHDDESRILQQLRSFCREDMANYHQRRDIPAETGTSQLSAYFSLGSLSVRTAWQMAQETGESEGARAWLDELLWREFYRHLTAEYNHISTGRAFKPQYARLPWQQNDEVLRAWQSGCTGYPLVDAAMRQLNTTGWMHNRLRMLTAVFLSKYALIDWRLGERYFMTKLIDGDFAANNGGWQWSASTGTDAVPYFRLLSPVRQAERFDPKAVFIKHFIPELSDFSARDICRLRHQQWLHSDYPQPVLKIKGARERVSHFFKQHQLQQEDQS